MSSRRSDRTAAGLTLRTPAVWAFLAALLFGCHLRWRGISDQIVFGDEGHAVRAALDYSYAHLFSHFFRADICIPLALLTRLIAETIGLDEVSLRLLPLVAGTALLVSLPWLAARFIGVAAAASLCGLLAISPFLIFFSRDARPYAVTTLCVALTVFGLLRWRCSPTRGGWLLCMASGVTAIYFHVLATPSLAAALVMALCEALRERGTGATPGQVIRLGAAIAAGAILLLLLPLLSSGELMSSRAFAKPVSFTTIVRASRLFSGTASTAADLLFWLLLALGTALGLARRRRLTVWLLAIAFVQVAAIDLLAPTRAGWPWIFARYCVWVLPLLLVVAVLPLSALAGEQGGARELGALGLGALLCAGLYAAGPLDEIYTSPGNFASHGELAFDRWWGRPRAPHPDPPALYERIAREAGRFEVLEVPWSWRSAAAYYRYQAVHGRPVRVGLVGGLSKSAAWGEFRRLDARLRFERYVDVSDPAALERARVGYLIVHLDPSAEFDMPLDEIDVEPVIRFWRERRGEPDYADRHLVAFRLDSPFVDDPSGPQGSAPR